MKQRQRLEKILTFAVGCALGSGLRHVWRRVNPPKAYQFRADPRVVLETARQRLQNQLSFADALDSKIATMFATGSALIGLLAAVFALTRPRVGERDVFGPGEVTILAVALFLYILIVLASVVAVWVRGWNIGPSVEDAFERIQTEPEDLFLATQISGYIDNYRRNRIINLSKVWATRLAHVAVIAEAGCVVAAVWRLIG